MAESSQGRTEGRRRDREEEGVCGIQFWPREGQGWELIARTPVLGQAPGHTVKLTRMQTVAMSDQI